LEDVPGRALDRVAAADFFTVEVLTDGGLVRYVIFFTI
jgi:hypothetical protein